MTDQTKEQFYDAEIAPSLAELARRCHERGLSLLAVCEWEPGEFGRTYTLQEDSGVGIRLADAAAKANGNIDSFMLGVMRYAHKHGHGSSILHQLGVSTTSDKSDAVTNPGDQPK